MIKESQDFINVDPSPILTILPSLVAASPAEFETNLF